LIKFAHPSIASSLKCCCLVLVTSLLLHGAAISPQILKETMLAPTPPLGWNSWDAYGTTVTEAEVKANTDVMASTLKQFGWQYIVVDIQWYGARLSTQCRACNGRKWPPDSRSQSLSIVSQ
jgi:hypothetical protein